MSINKTLVNARFPYKTVFMNLRDPQRPIEITEAYLKFTKNILSAHDQQVFEFAKSKSDELGKDFMSISPFEGQLIASFSGMTNPQLIVEIGTLTGYSALWLAKSLRLGGVVCTIEKDFQRAKMAEQVFNKAAEFHKASESCFYQRKIELKIGEALPLLHQITRAPEVVFIDANKSEYLEYTVWAKQALAPQGLILLDNAFLRGEVLSGQSQHFSKNQIESVRASLDLLMNDKTYDCFLLPTSEGLLVAHKRS